MKKKYKQISFSTTLRNPERILDFLLVFRKYDGDILNYDTIMGMMGDLISRGFYKPMRKSMIIKNKWEQGIELSSEEITKIFNDNPQNHKEKNFEKGWPSRWQTQYSLLKEFGFVNYSNGDVLHVTEKGNAVLKNEVSLQAAISHTLLSHSSSAFRAGQLSKQNIVLNLFLGIQENGFLTSDEIFAMACMIDNSKENRKKLLNNHSKENIEKIWGEYFPKNKYEKRRETVDDILRKIMMTGLFSVIFKKKKLQLKISDDYKNSSLDDVGIRDLTNLPDEEYQKLISKKPINYLKKESKNKQKEFLIYWDNKLSVNDAKKLIKECSRKKPFFHIKQLFYVPRFIVYELAIGILLHKNNPAYEIGLNLHFDSSFTPTAPASGGYSDIVLYSHKDKEKINVEVTLLLGVSQHMAESQSTIRHLIDSKAEKLLFIAPKLSRDLVNNYQFEAFRKKNKKLSLLNSELLLTNDLNINELIKLNSNFIKNSKNSSQIFLDFLNENFEGRKKYNFNDFI